MSFGINTSQDEHDMEWATVVDELQKENEILHAENSLKLTMILGLEQLLYDCRILDDVDGDGPCWCCSDPHDDYCIKARSATEPFWKK